MSANNQSIKFCKELSLANGWDKDSKRNVVTFDGEQWSFSVSKLINNQVECRQCYEDTVGFITYIPTRGTVMYYRMYDGQHQQFNVSRVSRNGVKSYNVSRHIIEMSTITDVKIPELI